MIRNGHCLGQLIWVLRGDMFGLAMEEPWREIKHNAVHFPIDWEDVVTQTARFGQGSSVPRRLSQQK